MIVATLLFGALPSAIASEVRSYTLLRADVRAGGEGRSKRRARRWLVARQMALALVMLSGAALLAAPSRDYSPFSLVIRQNISRSFH